MSTTTLSCCTRTIPEAQCIRCDGCRTWHHNACVGLGEEEGIKINRWFCDPCLRTPTSSTTITPHKRITRYPKNLISHSELQTPSKTSSKTPSKNPPVSSTTLTENPPKLSKTRNRIKKKKTPKATSSAAGHNVNTIYSQYRKTIRIVNASRSDGEKFDVYIGKNNKPKVLYPHSVLSSFAGRTKASYRR